jgi:hypothetical protein
VCVFYDAGKVSFYFAPGLGERTISRGGRKERLQKGRSAKVARVGFFRVRAVKRPTRGEMKVERQKKKRENQVNSSQDRCQFDRLHSTVVQRASVSEIELIKSARRCEKGRSQVGGLSRSLERKKREEEGGRRLQQEPCQGKERKSAIL